MIWYGLLFILLSFVLVTLIILVATGVFGMSTVVNTVTPVIEDEDFNF